MSNWHYVVVYDEDAANWLAANGYPHPPARANNRLPAWPEVEQAVESLGISREASLFIEPSVDVLKVRGDLLLELRVVRRLCERCGQLWVYPDCGSPAIVVDASMSPERLAEIWFASLDDDDSWRVFHERAYSAHSSLVDHEPRGDSSDSRASPGPSGGGLK